MNWLDICALEEINPLGSRIITGPKGDIAIFRTADDEVFALDDRCPHKGGPLGEGTVDGAVVTCPWHGFTVDVRTGRCPRNPALRVPTFPLAREGDLLCVSIPRDPTGGPGR